MVNDHQVFIAVAAVPADSKKLDARTQAKVLGAMIGLLGIAVGLVMLAWFVTRATRRLVRTPSKPMEDSLPDPNDWARKSLATTDSDGPSDE